MTHRISTPKAFQLKALVSALPAFAVLLATLAAAPAAHAQLTLTLTPASQAGPAGSTFHFTGTLTNPTASEVFLNGDTPTFNGPGSIDDSPFLNNAPGSLMPMGSTDPNTGAPTDSFTGSLFDVTLDPSAAPGTYFGTFEVQGGPTVNDQGVVASEDFSVTVEPPAVPEASTTVSLGLLLALGLGGVVVSARRRKPLAL
jgi:hypothetical protein